MSDLGCPELDERSMLQLYNAAEVFEQHIAESDRQLLCVGIADAFRRFSLKVYKLGDIDVVNSVVDVDSSWSFNIKNSASCMTTTVRFETKFSNQKICVRDLRTVLADEQDHIEVDMNSISAFGLGKFSWTAKMVVDRDIALAILVKSRVPPVSAQKKKDETHEQLMERQKQELMQEEQEEEREERTRAVRSVLSSVKRTSRRKPISLSQRVKPKTHKAPPPKEEHSASMLERISSFILSRFSAPAPKQSTNYVEAYAEEESLFLF
jgi:hypothetical protein